MRRKPEPNGQPGHVRIDTVHLGDLDKQKGVYHINAVDEVTQFEVVGSVEKISEQFASILTDANARLAVEVVVSLLPPVGLYTLDSATGIYA